MRSAVEVQRMPRAWRVRRSLVEDDWEWFFDRLGCLVIANGSRTPIDWVTGRPPSTINGTPLIGFPSYARHTGTKSGILEGLIQGISYHQDTSGQGLQFPMDPIYAGATNQVTLAALCVPTNDFEEANGPGRLLVWGNRDQAQTGGNSIGWYNALAGTSDSFAFRITDSGGTTEIKANSDDHPDDYVYPVIGVYDGTLSPSMTQFLYVNGELASASAAKSGNMVVDDTLYYYVGRRAYDTARTFPGHVLFIAGWPWPWNEQQVMQWSLDPFGPIRELELRRIFDVIAAGGGVDTENKRRSAMRFLAPWIPTFPVPDGTID